MAAKSRKRNKSRVKPKPLTTGTVIRFEEPKSDRSKPNIAQVVVQEVNPVGGFVNFLREHAVVGLAVGFVIGTQAQALVKTLVSSFIDPAFQLFFGTALSQSIVTWHFGGRAVNFTWGAFVYSLLNFLFVLAAVYAIVKIFKLDKLDKKPEDNIEEEDK